MECQCCLEERHLYPCPTEQCTFDMCKQCIANYDDVLCPACRQIRFEVHHWPTHEVHVNPRCFYTFAYISIIFIVIVVCLFATLYKETLQSLSIIVLAFFIILLWASFLLYASLRL